MKRIAALAALVVTMLAVPAAAALADTGASTGGPGPGYGRPGPVQVACQLPDGFRKGPVKVQAYARAHRIHHRKPLPIRIVCPNPYPKVCGPQQLVFNMAAGSSTVTEVSGPVLSPKQEFSYGGGTYTITSVNPGAGSFTVFKDGWLFVNQGTAITDGVGWLGCSA
jgi:hypothetical protein